jgi:diguanylate cyclase (GGDEF)-like protein
VGNDDPRTILVSEAGRRATEEKLAPTLTVLEGPEVGAFYALREGRGTHRLGRAEDADVQIAAASVSRYHVIFEVVRKAGRPAIQARDNGSTNGILINGQSVEQMWLVSGDKIRAGDVLLRFEWMSSAEVRYHRDVSNKLQAGARDHLTGLLTRVFLEQRLGPLLDEVDRRAQPACCLLVDLDHFKAINDTHGHLAGDQVLQRVSAVVQESLRRTDYAIRYGGEELLLVMPDLGLEWGVEVADRLRARIAAIDLSDVAQGLSVTASIGLALRREGEDAGSWLERADQAMYRAKAEGRNRTAVADDPASATTDPRLRVSAAAKADIGATQPRQAPVSPTDKTEELPGDLLDYPVKGT